MDRYLRRFAKQRIVLFLFTIVMLAGARPAAPQSGSPLLPFGPKQTPVTQFGMPPFTGAYINAGSVTELEQRLAEARRKKMRLIVKLAPAHDNLLSPSTGCFDIDLWKSAINTLRSVDFAPYVADGTVIGAEIVNEPHASDWCVSTPMRLSKDTVEAMLAYAKSIWPTLPVGCGRSDWVLANAPWKYLDFGHSQYHMRKGDINAWIATTVQESRGAGVGLLLSLNFLAGQVDDSPMTAEQLRAYGSALAKDTYACMLTGYLYDASYLAQPGVLDAFEAIASIAASHPAPPCHAGISVKAPPGTPRTPKNLHVIR